MVDRELLVEPVIVLSLSLSGRASNAGPPAGCSEFTNSIITIMAGAHPQMPYLVIHLCMLLPWV